MIEHHRNGERACIACNRNSIETVMHSKFPSIHFDNHKTTFSWTTCFSKHETKPRCTTLQKINLCKLFSGVIAKRELFSLMTVCVVCGVRAAFSFSHNNPYHAREACKAAYFFCVCCSFVKYNGTPSIQNY